MARYTIRTTSVRFEDAAGLGIAADPGPGDLTIGNTNSENAERLRVLNRGVFDCFVIGDDLEQEWSLTIGQEIQSLTEALQARIRDFIQKTGLFAAAVSVDGNASVWAFKVIVTFNRNGTVATMELPHNVADQSWTEAKEGNSFTISGRNNGAIIVT